MRAEPAFIIAFGVAMLIIIVGAIFLIPPSLPPRHVDCVPVIAGGMIFTPRPIYVPRPAPRVPARVQPPAHVQTETKPKTNMWPALIPLIIAHPAHAKDC